MARTCTADSQTYGTVNQSTKMQSIQFQRSVSSDHPDDRYAYFWHVLQINPLPAPATTFDEELEGDFPRYRPFTEIYTCSHRCDLSDEWWAMAKYVDADLHQNLLKNSTKLAFKPYAIDPTVGTPALSAQTAFTVTVNGTVNPGTYETTVAAFVQYKKQTDVDWLTWPTACLSAVGESAVAISATTVTGLTPATVYNFRLYLDRTNTTNVTKAYYSAVVTTNTLADDPEAETLPAGSLSGGAFGVSNDGAATLPGRVYANKIAPEDISWRFVWDTDSGEPYAYSSAWIADLEEPDPRWGWAWVPARTRATGLTEEQTYYFRIEIRWIEGTTYEYAYGDELSFLVPTSPAEKAAKEAQMFVYDYDAIQGEDKDIYFSYRDVSTVSSDRYLSVGVTTIHPAADGGGDVLIYIDGVLKTTNSGKPDNSITQIGATTLYTLTLDGSTELIGEDIMIQFVDQGGPYFRDFTVHVRTKIKTSQLRADASLGLTDESGFVVSGEGTGHGFEANGGVSGFDIYGVIGSMAMRRGTCQTHAVSGQAKLDTGANATDEYYTGGLMLIYGGTGSEQARPIIAYDGTDKIVYLASPWVVQPTAGSKYAIIPAEQPFTQAPAITEGDAELSGVPTSVSSWGDKLQFLFQRFAFKIEQTATTQTWYGSDSVVVLGTRTVDDDGQKQQLGKLS